MHHAELYCASALQSCLLRWAQGTSIMASRVSAAHLEPGVDSQLEDALQGGVDGRSGPLYAARPHHIAHQHLPAGRAPVAPHLNELTWRGFR
jgi:hypothetical protein